MADSVVQSIIFWIFAVLAVGSALTAMLHRSIVYSVLFLIVVFLSIAGFFILNNADFLAIAQLIIYAVGITIIMLFAIMFTGDQPAIGKPVSPATKAALTIVTLYTLGVLLRAAMYPFETVQPGATHIHTLQTQGSTQLLGSQLFNMYALPFEVASILLLIAMIGAIIISKKSFEEHDLGDVRFDIDRESRPPADARAALEAKARFEREAVQADIHPEAQVGESGQESTVGASR